MTAFQLCGDAAAKHGKAYMTFVANAAGAEKVRKYGVSMFFIASEHSWMRAGATADAKGVHCLT